jgi:hypothetical protein
MLALPLLPLLSPFYLLRGALNQNVYLSQEENPLIYAYA